jgi:hypothetical protein
MWKAVLASPVASCGVWSVVDWECVVAELVVAGCRLRLVWWVADVVVVVTGLLTEWSLVDGWMLRGFVVAALFVAVEGALVRSSVLVGRCRWRGWRCLWSL